MGFDVRGDSPQGRPMVWRPDQQVVPRRAESSFERAGVVRWSVVVLLAMVALGLLGGLLWALLADPPGYTVSRESASMGEAESGKQFGVEVLYAGVAAALGLAAGLLAGWRLARYGWVLVLTLALGGVGAASGSLVTGRWLGPADPSQAIASAPVGTVVPVQLTVEATGLLFMWSAAALVGLLLVVGLVGLPVRGSVSSTGPLERGSERSVSH